MIELSKIKLEPILSSARQETISDDVYFSQEYSHYISNSRLKYINPQQGGSPSAYKECKFEGGSDALILGSAVHELFLQPEQFKLSELTCKPSGKAGLAIDAIIRYRQQGMSIRDSVIAGCTEVDYYKGCLTKNRAASLFKKGLEYYFKSKDLEPGEIVLAERMRNTCIKCVEALKRPYISDIIAPTPTRESYNEDALFIEVRATYNDTTITLPLKMKADNWTIDFQNKILVLNDVKTTGKYIEGFITGSFATFHYSRQMAMYLWMLTQYCINKYGVEFSDWTIQTNMLVVETNNAEPKAAAFNVPNDVLFEGLTEFQNLLKRVAYCQMFGYDDEIQFIND